MFKVKKRKLSPNSSKYDSVSLSEVKLSLKNDCPFDEDLNKKSSPVVSNLNKIKLVQNNIQELFKLFTSRDDHIPFDLLYKQQRFGIEVQELDHLK